MAPRKVFLVAHLPPDLERAWLQHVRDFDVAHPGCHFEIAADAPELSLREMVEMLRVEPELTFQELFSRATKKGAR